MNNNHKNADLYKTGKDLRSHRFFQGKGQGREDSIKMHDFLSSFSLERIYIGIKMIVSLVSCFKHARNWDSKLIDFS